MGDFASAIEMHKMAVATAPNDNGRALAVLCQKSAQMVQLDLILADLHQFD